MLESDIVRSCVKYLKSQGAFVYKSHGSPLQTKGLPDLIVCYHGQFYGIEVKRPGEDATKLQKYVLNEIEQAGGIAAVVHSVEEVKDVLNVSRRSLHA